MLRAAGRRGVTAVELLASVVIIGTALAAGFALYRVSVEKVRKVEAIITLGALRESQMRHFSWRRSFAADLAALDFDPNAAPEGHPAHFAYAIESADESHFTAVATRNAVERGDGKSTVTIDETGTFGGTM